VTPQQFIAAARTLMAPIERRIKLMALRTVLDLVDDSQGRQMIQVHFYGGAAMFDQIERFQQYGFSSVPFQGAEAIVITMGGNHSHALALAVEDVRYKPKNWQQGESGLYDDQAQLIHITRDGIVIDGGTSQLPVTFKNMPSLKMECDLHVTGEVTAKYGTGASVTLTGHATSNVAAGTAQSGPPVGGT